MKARFKLILIAVFAAFFLSGCVATGGGFNRNGGGIVSVNDGGGMRTAQRGRGMPPGYQQYPVGGPQYQMVQGQPYQMAPQPVFYGPGGAVYTTPCQPFQADALMAWAQGAGGNTQHSRSAQVTTNNGYVNCRTSEGASSANSVQATK